MKLAHSAIALAIGTLLSATAFAQDGTTTTTQRDVYQQQRIDQGLQSGQLTTHEASTLEHQESHLDKVQSRAMSDGTVTSQEQQHITSAENRVSKDIYGQKHDAQTGNPNSRSSQRMQSDVQRNVNQQRRISQGERSGQLSQGQAGRLERGQARSNRQEARAGANGRYSRREQWRTQRGENRQSRHIFGQRQGRQARR